MANAEAQLALAGGSPLTALHAAEAEEQPLRRWLIGQLGASASSTRLVRRNNYESCRCLLCLASSSAGRTIC
ncbi:hypothetical protein ACTMU2_31365 [Cupriavidus basilensis]